MRLPISHPGSPHTVPRLPISDLGIIFQYPLSCSGIRDSVVEQIEPLPEPLDTSHLIYRVSET